MMKRPFALLLSVAVFSGVCTLAQGPEEIDGTVSADPAQATSAAPTILRMRGTIEKYDASTRTLSLSTPNATVQFPLTSTARIRQGWRKIDVSDLKSLTGYRVVVRYSEPHGSRTVESIHVFGKSDR